MENKMADKTVTTCASVLYALFQKKAKNNVKQTATIGLTVPKTFDKQRKCSCLCHTYENKKDELKNETNKFFHCKCNSECELANKTICENCSSFINKDKQKIKKKKEKIKNSSKLKKKKIVKFQIEHTGSLNNVGSPNKPRKTNLLNCTCDLQNVAWRSPSLRKILTVRHTSQVGELSARIPALQEKNSPSSKNTQLPTGSLDCTHVEQLPSYTSSTTGNTGSDNRPKSFYEWGIPYHNLEIGEKEAESPKGPVHRGRWHGDVMIYMRSFHSQDELEMFHDEVSLLGLIRHENVVLFMGASFEPPNLAVVTSVRKGQSLHTHLHVKQTSFHFGSKFSICKQVAQGMGYLHAKGITLGKLCSRNIFLEAKVKIGITEYTMVNEPVVKRGYGYIPKGHLSYFSPEQMRTLHLSGLYVCVNEKSTQKSDVYAYGTLMHEIFLGRYPFKDKMEAQTIIWRVSKGQVAAVDATDFPAMFKDLMQSCWQSNPDKRPEFQEIISNMRKLNIPRSLQKKLSLSDSGAINREQHLLMSPFRIHNSPSQHQWRKK